MFPSFLLALREGLEAALIIGIVLGVLNKTKRQNLSNIVWLGTAAAVGLSILAGLGLYLLGAKFEGQAEEVFEGLTMLLAAGVLTWMVIWMSRQAQTMSQELKAEVQQAARSQSKGGLFAIAFLAVVREGIELALFLTAASFNSDAGQTLIGALLGLGATAVLAWALFKQLLQMDLKKFFTITSVLLVLFAAGLVAHGVHELNEAGWIPGVIEHVWDMNPVLDEKSFAGQILKALFGYNGNPSLTEVIAYVLYYPILWGVYRWQRRQFTPARSAAQT